MRLFSEFFPKRRIFVIRTKLVTLITFLVGVISLFIFIYFPDRQEKQEIEAIAAKAQSISEMTAFSVTSALFFEDIENIQQILEGTKQNKDLAYVVILDGSGQAIDAFNKAEAEQANFIQTEDDNQVSRDGTIYKTMTPIMLDDREIGRLYLGLSLKELRIRITRSRTSVALVSLLIFVIGIITVFGISSLITRPLSQMVKTVKQISDGDLKKRALVSSRDEVGHLASSFNLMVDNLQREIDERKLAEEALRKSERKYRTLVENIPQKIFFKNKNLIYVSCNENYAKDLKIQPEEITGKIDYDFYPRYLAEKYRGDDKRIMESGITEDIEERYIQDGQESWVHTLKTPVKDENENVVGILGLFWDITERKLAEVELKKYRDHLEEEVKERTAKLEAANEELGIKNAELDQFTYIASHDLQEPLRKVTVFCELLEKDLSGNLPEQAKRDMNFIIDAARRMQTLVQDLLAFSRAGRKAIKMEKLSLNDCANQAIEALAIRVKETGAEITRDKLPQVWGDQTMLIQLYQNLISNALKFTGETRPVIHLTAERIKGRIILGVKDNGIGIKPEYAEQIFAPFKRLHGRGKYEGTGIGLAICRKTVERHGGKIWVESELGKGAHFKFTINERERTRKEESSWDNSMESLQLSCSPKMTRVIRS
jgi:PAS domain S-box-containing protein